MDENHPPDGRKEPRKSKVCYLCFTVAFVPQLGLQQWYHTHVPANRSKELAAAQVMETEQEPAGTPQADMLPANTRVQSRPYFFFTK